MTEYHKQRLRLAIYFIGRQPPKYFDLDSEQCRLFGFDRSPPMELIMERAEEILLDAIVGAYSPKIIE